MRRSIRYGVVTGATLALTASAVGATTATAAPVADKVDIDRVGYHQTLRAAAVEPYAEIPRTVPVRIGGAEVWLIKGIGNPSNCYVMGDGYYADEIVEDGVIKGGAGPVSEKNTAIVDTRIYENPTLSRTARYGETESTVDVTPMVPHGGNGPLFKSSCSEDRLAGSATGEWTNAAGFRAVGSHTDAAVDPATGVYTGTARSYASGLDGTYDSVVSMMQIVHAPNEEPTITYRMSFFESEASASGFGSDGFTLSGTEVPASEYVATFNEQAEAFAGSAAALGPAGLRLVSPRTFKDQDRGFTAITGGVIEGNIGAAARESDAGQNQGVRIASITWIGDNIHFAS